MTKMEKELIERLENACQTEARVTLRLIRKLQKELEEKTTILMAGADKVKQLEKENEKLKEAIESLKDKIREFIEKELPDDDLMEACSIVDVNGIAIREELEKIIRGGKHE